MPVEKDLYEKIAAYLSGNISPEDKINLEEWRKAHVENERLFQEATTIWKHSGIKMEYDGDADNDWNALQSILDRHEKVSFWTTTWFKVAAAVTVLLISLVWIFNINKSETDQLAETLQYKSGAAVESFVLPDSSTVWLNSNSTLEYSLDLVNKSRTVNLIGEAYFKVRRDDSVAFTVLTHNSETRVLGTAFNLSQRDKTTSLAVDEGEVKFSSRVTNDQIIVRPKEAALISNTDKPVRTKYSAETANWRKNNNSTFEKEKESPKSFMHTEFKWRKNAINLSVIEGDISSSATLAVYKNISLKVSYEKRNGKIVTTNFTVAGPLRASEKIHFEKRLLDLFSDTQNVTVEVESAEVF